MRARISPPCLLPPSARSTSPGTRCVSSTTARCCVSTTMARGCRRRCGRSMSRHWRASAPCRRSSNGTPTSRRWRYCSRRRPRQRFISSASRREGFMPPERLMPSLRELQNAVRTSLVERDDSVAASYIVDDGLAPERRLSVYRNTFASNLVNALRLSYPAVHRLVGDEFFEVAAHVFVHERPPVSAYLDEYGAEFAEFLARFPPAASLGYLADVARIEWAVNRALHAPDAEPLDVTRLAALEQNDHDRVRFVPHPSVSLVSANYPVDAIWRAVLAQDDSALAAIDLAAGGCLLLVERLATGV